MTAIRVFDRTVLVDVTPASKCYRLMESVNGGDYQLRSIAVRIPADRLDATLANWLVARADYWRERGYVVKRSKFPHECTARNVSSFIVFRLVEVVDGE